MAVAAVVAAAVGVALLASDRAPEVFGGAAASAGRAAWSRQAPPATLAATGLYVDVVAKTLAPGVRTYTPQYALWTDGARKARFLALPPGAAIDARDPEVWSFPVGTRLWKEFAFERRVETRYLERAADGWLAATYVWDAAETDATLAPMRGVRGAAGSRPGVRTTPGRADCRACHDGRATPVLGVSALQLSSDRDPLAPHAEPVRPDDLDLDALVQAGLVAGLPDAVRARPPRIDAPTPRARAVLGYFHANCGACHTSSGLLAPLDLVLDADARDRAGLASAMTSIVGHVSKVRVPSARGVADVRVVPGDPEASVLWRRITSREPSLQMPPLGSRVVDVEGAALVEAWIREDLAPSRSVPVEVPSPLMKENVR